MSRESSPACFLVIYLVLLIALFLLLAKIVQISWNYAATKALTIAQPIDYWPAVVLCILTALLFGGSTTIVNSFNTTSASASDGTEAKGKNQDPFEDLFSSPS